MNMNINFPKRIKTYFEYVGTISGGDYLFRNIIASVGAFIGAFFVKYGLEQSTFMVILGLLILLPSCWLSITNIYKRINALFSNNVNVYTIGLLFLQILNTFNKGNFLGFILILLLIIISGILIFRNSNISNHEG